MRDIARIPTDWKTAAMQRRIRRRYAAERRFRLIGLGAVLLSAAFLAFLLITIMANGLRGFTQTEVRLDIDFAASDLFLDPATLQGPHVDRAIASVNIDGVVRNTDETQNEGVSALLSDDAWLRVPATNTDDQIGRATVRER